MRVVAGVAGGLRLQAPPNDRTRPTSDRVREALFSSLTSLDAIDGARVLDLFAGSGALGIEALSRGASEATFVDNDAAAVATVEANLASTRLDGGRVVRADVLTWLGRGGVDADLVLADPPYAFDAWPQLLERLPPCLVALESDHDVDLDERWVVLRRRRYGDTVVTLARPAP